MRHLLSAADLDRTAAVRLLDVAEQMAATQQREIKKQLEAVEEEWMAKSEELEAMSPG